MKKRGREEENKKKKTNKEEKKKKRMIWKRRWRREGKKEKKRKEKKERRDAQRSLSLSFSLSLEVWKLSLTAEKEGSSRQCKKESWRTGQYSTGQDRTGQDRTGQDRTGQDNLMARRWESKVKKKGSRRKDTINERKNEITITVERFKSKRESNLNRERAE